MFTLHWNGLSMALAALAALSCEFWLSWLLHLRYDRQFGWSFIVSGLVAFSLPAFSTIGVAVYLILESGMALSDRILMLAALALCCLYSGWRLKHRILSKIFKARTPSPPSVSEGSEEPAL